MRGIKSVGNVEETGTVEGSWKISGLIDMHEKPNGSNGILETVIDEDIQYCLFKYLTPRLCAQVIINLGSLIEI